MVAPPGSRCTPATGQLPSPSTPKTTGFTPAASAPSACLANPNSAAGATGAPSIQMMVGNHSEWRRTIRSSHAPRRRLWTRGTRARCGMPRQATGWSGGRRLRACLAVHEAVDEAPAALRRSGRCGAWSKAWHAMAGMEWSGAWRPRACVAAREAMGEAAHAAFLPCKTKPLGKRPIKQLNLCPVF